MKILMIYPIDNMGKKIGGIETFIRGFVEYCQEEIEIVGISIGKTLRLGLWHNITFYNKKVRFFPVIKVKDPNKRTIIPLVLKFVIGLIRWKYKINFQDRIVIFHRIEPFFPLIKVLSTNKKILFVHGDIQYFKNKYCESKWKFIKFLYYFIEPIFIKHFQKIFVVSQNGCNYYKLKYPKYAERFLFCPSFYSPQIHYKLYGIKKDEIFKKYNINTETEVTKIILYVGRLELPKDPFLLIESFYLILKYYNNAKLIIVGNGKLKDKLIKRIKKLNLEGKVYILGEKNRQEVALLMNVSDVLLLTSAFEGMPAIVIEALACGLPVVTTNVGDVNLVVKDGISGKIVNSRRPEDIANAVIDILKTPLNPQDCQNMVSNYSEDKVLSFLFNELKKV